jgi:PAS domain S-box-containing protein
MRQYVARLLAEQFRVEVVPDGEAALTAAHQHLPDLVLTDVMMPRLDGFGLLRELRADSRTSGVPIILLSARAGEESRVEGMEAGADDYLVKPFSARELLARVSAHLQMARLRREANESLRKSEERFRALVDASSDAVYRMSATWDEMQYLQGREFISDTQEPSRTWLEKYIHPDDRQRVMGVIREAIRTRSVFELEHRVLRADGTVGRTFSRAVPLPDTGGEVVEWLGTASDVTARKQAEEELQQERDRLRVTLASIGDAVITTDTEGRITFLNSVAESLTGWTNAEAAGRPLETVFRIVNEGTRQPVESPATKALRKGVIVGLANHTVLIRKDGLERPIDDSAAPVRDGQGHIVGCVLVFRDVSERRAAELAQAERSRLVALHADVSTAVAAAQPLRTGLQECCEAIVRHLDVAFTRIWTHDEAAGVLELEASAGLYTHIHGPYSRIKVGEFAIGSIARSRRPLLTNDVPHDPNLGTPAWIERDGMVAFAGYPLAVEGRLIGVLAVFARHPLTEASLADLPPLTEQIAQHIDRKRTEDALRESELRYRLVGQAANDAIWDWDLDTNRVTWNEGLRRVFGYTAEQVGADVSWWVRHIHPEDRDRVAQGIRSTIWGGEELWQGEYRYLRADGSYAAVFDRGRVVREDGKPVRMVGSMLDLTERKQMEDRLRQIAAELSEADRRKDEFLATLAHELRNPLAPIRNALQILRLSPDRDAREHARSLIERQVGQMVRLVDDLMDVGRISRGKLELRRELVPLAAVVTAAVETSRPLIEEMGHQLTIVIPDLPIPVEADLTRLAQVFMNLLTNAAKYTDRGGRIALSAEREGSDVIVSVRDTGIGIPADQLTSIFDMFAQVDRSLEKAQGGLGIGLTLVKRLVEMHSGRIEAKSDGPGRGSEFVVRLPVMGEASAPSTAGPENSALPRSSHRILIVDDNRDGADSLRVILQLMGNDARTAYDGQAGVELAGQFRPDVVLLDIGLPKLNGYEACRRIREQAWGKNVVLIAVTGWGQDEDRRRSHAAGFDHHMVKPVDPDGLMKLLAGLPATNR